MAKKKKKKSNPETSERNKKIAIFTAITLGATGIFVSAGMGIKVLDTHAASLITDSTPIIHINWGTDTSNHIWLPIAERDRIESKVQAAIAGAKPLSWHPLYNASKALSATGWVDGQPIARWNSDGSITIDANWRPPAAAVRDGNRDYIIGWGGHVLPLDYAINQSNQFVIHNPTLPNPGVGMIWDEPEIHDALRLLRDLRHNNLDKQVVGVDLGTDQNHGILHLLTNGNARIVWGGGPGRDRPAEMPSSVKMERLLSLSNKTGRIDAGMMIVDVRGQHILTQRHEN